MGGAYVAIANSPEAATWNPAGLVQNRRPSLAFSLGVNLNSQNVELNQFAGMKILSDVNPLLYPTFASAHYPFMLGERVMTIGFSYHRASSLSGQTKEGVFVYPSGNLNQFETPGNRIYSLLPTAAVEILPSLSVGAGVNFLSGSNDYRFELKSPFLEEIALFSYSKNEEVSGTFVDLGLRFQPVAWLALGAKVTPGWTYKIEEKREFVVITNSTDNFFTTAGDTIESSADMLSTYRLELPTFFTVGVALRPTSDWTLAFDYEARPWSNTKVRDANGAVTHDLSNADAMHVGLEYVAAAAWAEFPLRLGYYTNPSPYKDRYFEGQYYGQQIEGGIFTVGIGVMRKQWAFDFSIESGKRTIDWWVDSGDFYNDRIARTEKNFTELSFSASYGF